jgi:hypothetical protein
MNNEKVCCATMSDYKPGDEADGRGVVAINIVKYYKGISTIRFEDRPTPLIVGGNNIKGTFTAISIQLKDTLTLREIYNLENKIYHTTCEIISFLDINTNTNTNTNFYRQHTPENDLILIEVVSSGGTISVWCFDCSIIKNYVDFCV